MNRHSMKTAARRARIQVSRLAVEEARRQLQAEQEARDAADRARREAEGDWAEKIGAPAFASIADMVAALQCDRKRLEQLREERDGFEFDPDANAAPDGPGYANDREAWAGENPDDAEELAELEEAAGDAADEDEARERIQDDALSVQVRSGWVAPGTENLGGAEEFEILLSTGGPATRIVGELDEHGQPTSARLEVQDWFKPWTEYVPADSDVLLAYAACFYFGD